MAELTEEFLDQIRQATGLVRMEGPVTWHQQQMLEGLEEPLARKIVIILRDTPVGKRDWSKILTQLAKENSPS